MAEYKYTSHPYKRRKNGKACSCLIHIRIWIEHNGKILIGMIIHHKNGDKYDNRIDNLECISRSDHTKEHNRRLKVIRLTK